MGGGLLTGFLALMVSGLPVAMAMAVASLAYVMISGTIPDFVVIHRMYGGVDSFPLLAVPFFIWAGNLMNSAGITNRIYNFALALVGWLKGGLGHVNVVGSMIFAGMSGTAIADAAGVGTLRDVRDSRRLVGDRGFRPAAGPRQDFRFLRCDGAPHAGDAGGRHDDGRLHPDGRRDRRIDVGAVPRPRVVPHARLAPSRQ